ncbi:hypothetical protein, partial [Collinsella aerofaciens]|uniref:hypothetical protein n=1 Tax=Collinsella aerofaciens TaxID=74426 RepID=UPI002912E5D8
RATRPVSGASPLAGFRFDKGRPLCNRKKMTGRNVNPGLTEPFVVSVNLFFTSFAKQARRSRKGGFTGCANVFSPIPVTA